MIHGRFVAGRPVVDVVVMVPRLDRSGVVRFLVDSGSDGTALTERDWRALGVSDDAFGGRTVASAGVGGVVHAAIESCGMRLTHEDGRENEWEIDIELMPLSGGSIYVPSFIGRDILINYRLYMSIAERDLRLEPLP